MSDDEDFGWDEEDIEEMEASIDAPYDYEKDEGSALSEMQKHMFENRVISTFVRNAYDFGGTNTLLEVLGHVERKMGWRTEIIADRNALDDYMFYRHETFDEDVWSYYANSDEYEELVRQIAFISEKAMSDFVELYSETSTPKKTFKKKLRKLAWAAYKNLS
jgi:hypothetical protein